MLGNTYPICLAFSLYSSHAASNGADSNHWQHKPESIREQNHASWMRTGMAETGLSFDMGQNFWTQDFVLGLMKTKLNIFMAMDRDETLGT